MNDSLFWGATRDVAASAETPGGRALLFGWLLQQLTPDLLELGHPDLLGVAERLRATPEVTADMIDRPGMVRRYVGPARDACEEAERLWASAGFPAQQRSRMDEDTTAAAVAAKYAGPAGCRAGYWAYRAAGTAAQLTPEPVLKDYLKSYGAGPSISITPTGGQENG